MTPEEEEAEALALAAAAKAKFEVGDTGGIAAHTTQGALMSFGDEYLAGLSAVLGVQPDGAGGANWFQYDKPIKERYGVALDQIRTEMDSYRDENPVKAGVANVAGAVGTGVLTAAKVPIAAAKTLPGRIGQVAGGGVVAGAIEGAGSGEGAGDRLASAGVGAVVGGVFAPVVGIPLAKVAGAVGKIGGRTLQRVFTSRKLYNHQTGELTDAGRARLSELGYDATQLSNELQRSFGITAATLDNAGFVGPAQREVAERVALADRFNVPLTRGQATGDVAQWASEESMRAGVRGQGAAQTVGAFDEVQGNAIDRSRVAIGDKFGDPNARIEAADAVIGGVRREADSARAAGSEAYKALDESGAALTGSAFPTLSSQIKAGVASEGFPLDAATPNAASALKFLETTFSKAGKGAVPFAELKRARQVMLSLSRSASSGSNGADKIATARVVKEFDGWLDDNITEALISGDDAVLGQAKNARELWKRYRSTFLGKDGADRFIRKIVEDDLAPDQVAGWLFGASNNMGGGTTSLVAKRVRDILGKESKEWGEVRRAAWDHVTMQTSGKAKFGPQAVVGNISNLIEPNGKGYTLAKELFTDAELRGMREFRNMLKALIPPQKATNPSGSGYQVERGMKVMLEGFAGMIGAQAGGPVTGAATSAAVRSGGNFSGTLQARAAVRGIVPKPTSGGAAVGAGVGVESALQEEFVR